ncbi:MAG: flagellar capping protein [Lachnospiraceae bacterium]|nr:flagellar capping protein [Lachnospiraceae bacterium]
MAYNSALNSVYNHYLSSYAPKSTSRYDTHKKSELRSIYNSIVKLNKESPLYLPTNSKDTQNYVIGLKENARSLRNTIASLGGLAEDEMLNKKVAFSSKSDMVTAGFIGDVPEDAEIPSFEIEVKSLASGQINIGEFLPSSAPAVLPPNAYSFDVNINDLSYVLQYNIHEGETNREIQERLSRLISNADIGLKADIVEDGNGNSALRLSSVATGIKNDQTGIFHISDDNTSKARGSVAYLGLDSVIKQPSNAEFLLNGEPRSASSNHFTIDKMFEVELLRESTQEGEVAEIGLKADVDSLTENVSDLIMGYNSFINAAAGYLDSFPRSGRLVNELRHISLNYQEGLTKMGVSFTEDGHMALNQDALRQTALSDGGKESLSTIREFTNSILGKTSQVSLNPMHYVDRTIVAYKNPGGHNYASPYVTSAYSGMMFNSYC